MWCVMGVVCDWCGVMGVVCNQCGVWCGSNTTLHYTILVSILYMCIEGSFGAIEGPLGATKGPLGSQGHPKESQARRTTTMAHTR